tara:strand:- start:40 stop:651 length:612 start_codon:yes stop_codon:yes gene_type:complete
MNNYIVFDCETGGLDPKVNPITEIALLAFSGEDFKEIAKYETFIAPYGAMQYEPKALEITKISMEMIRSGKPYKTVVKELISFFKDVKRKGRMKPLLIAHNANFDKGMIEELFTQAGKNLYDSVEPIYLDTMWLSRLKDPDKPKHNLGTVCQREGIELVNAHRAMDDVEATKEVFSSIIGKMRSNDMVASNDQKTTFRATFKF